MFCFENNETKEKKKLDYQVIEIKINPEIELLLTILFQTHLFPNQNCIDKKSNA